MILIHNLYLQPQWSFLGFRITGFMPVAVEEDSNWYLHCPGGSIDEDEREVKAQELWTTTKMDPLVSDFWHLLSKAASLLVDSFQKEYFQNVASFCQSLSITIVSQITGSHKRPNKQTNQLMWRQEMNIWWEKKPFSFYRNFWQLIALLSKLLHFRKNVYYRTILGLKWKMAQLFKTLIKTFAENFFFIE